MSTRVRLHVVIPAIVFGSFAAVGAWIFYLHMRPPSFAATWDINVAATAPVIFPIVKADPVLHRLMVDKTGDAFAQGGWPAASQVFFRIADNRINIYAGDAAVLACHAAWRDVYRALLPTPHVCAQVIAKGTGETTRGIAREPIIREVAACNEVTRDGGRRRASIDPPGHMDPSEAMATFSRALDVPQPLPAAERDALDDPGRQDERALCSAWLHVDENIAALPPGKAARYYRSEYSTDQGDFVYGGAETHPAPGNPPADFHCAPRGTRFTLSMEAGATGLPIVWESLGQDGWDCRLRSSVSGAHDLIVADEYAHANMLRLLWPLAAGKTAHCHCDYGRLSDFRVNGPYALWLPIGTTQAWGIDEIVRGPDGTTLYTKTRYWAPELGFVVGQRTVVSRGAWPDDVAPDWQVVAKE